MLDDHSIKLIGRVSADSLGRHQTAPAENFNSYLWENTAKVVRHCLQYKNTASQQFFEVAALLFRSTGDAYYGTLDVSRYVHDWSGLLLKHEHEEVGWSPLDWVFIAND